MQKRKVVIKTLRYGHSHESPAKLEVNLGGTPYRRMTLASSDTADKTKDLGRLETQPSFSSVNEKIAQETLLVLYI